MPRVPCFESLQAQTEAKLAAAKAEEAAREEASLQEGGSPALQMPETNATSAANDDIRAILVGLEAWHLERLLQKHTKHDKRWGPDRQIDELLQAGITLEQIYSERP